MFLIFPSHLADYQINFSSAPTGDMVCSRSLQCTTENICGWIGHTITAMEPTAFRVRIGPSGGLRGYEYITGEVNWSSCLSDNLYQGSSSSLVSSQVK